MIYRYIYAYIYRYIDIYTPVHNKGRALYIYIYTRRAWRGVPQRNIFISHGIPFTGFLIHYPFWTHVYKIGYPFWTRVHSLVIRLKMILGMIYIYILLTDSTKVLPKAPPIFLIHYSFWTRVISYPF